MTSPKLLSEISEILGNLPILSTADGRQAFLIKLNFPNHLINLIYPEKPLAIFVPLLIDTASKYGELDDGTPAILAILLGARENVGKDKVQIINSLIDKYFGQIAGLSTELKSQSVYAPSGQLITNNEIRSIAFIASNPIDASPLRTPKEFREIQEIFQSGKEKTNYRIVYEMAAMPEDISRIILNEKPWLVHLSVHGTTDGRLRLENSKGITQFVEIQALVKLCKLSSGLINCVILNACGSDKHAHFLAEYVDYVIGMPQEIKDSASRFFSMGFYKALAAGENIEASYEYGCTELNLQGIHDLKPLLAKKKSS
jgi:hypothetical protein